MTAEAAFREELRRLGKDDSLVQFHVFPKIDPYLNERLTLAWLFIVEGGLAYDCAVNLDLDGPGLDVRAISSARHLAQRCAYVIDEVGKPLIAPPSRDGKIAPGGEPKAD